MTRGRFITFEGGEGVGKSTQVRRLADRLRGRGEVVTTREPGGSPGAEAIRGLLVTGEVERWSPISETLLMYAARRDHIERLIEPALSRGAWVICDRFYDSSRAYQGAAGGAPASLLRALEADVVGELIPDLTLILDLPVEIGLERGDQEGARREGKDEGRFEAKGAAFHERLRAAFLNLAAAEPERCRVIDADAGIDAVLAEQINAASVIGRWPGSVAAMAEPIEVPHPREVFRLMSRARRSSSSSWTPWNRGRVHHAWLLCGPEGVGKATFAYRTARRLFGARRRPIQPTACSAPSPTARSAARSSPIPIPT